MNRKEKFYQQRALMADVSVEPASPAAAKTAWRIYKNGRLDSQPNEALGITKQDVWAHLCDPGNPDGQIDWWEERARQGELLAAFQDAPRHRINGIVWPNVDEEGQRWLSKLYVARCAKGLGIADKLIQATLTWHHYEPVRLLVAAYNETAIRVYERNDFEQVGERESGYLLAGKPIPQVEMLWTP
jgi:ribosomal protein S18 acetylase RimI-like enzyme